MNNFLKYINTISSYKFSKKSLEIWYQYLQSMDKVYTAFNSYKALIGIIKYNLTLNTSIIDEIYTNNGKLFLFKFNSNYYKNKLYIYCIDNVAYIFYYNNDNNIEEILNLYKKIEYVNIY